MKIIILAFIFLVLSTGCEKATEEGEFSKTVEEDEFSNMVKQDEIPFEGREVIIVETGEYSDIADYARRNQLGNYLRKLNDTYYEYGENKPFTGKLIYQIVKGKTEEERIYKEGKKIIEITYFDNGNKESYNEYKNGYLHGKQITWYENGQQETEKNLVKDPQQNYEYSRSSVKDGVESRWYKSGQIMMKDGYKMGELHGKHIVWYENGERKFEWTYVDGVANGPATWWDENGNITKTGVYKNKKFIKQ